MRKSQSIGGLPLRLAFLALLVGCGGATAPESQNAKPRPVARAQIEIRAQGSSHPDPNFDATLQTGGIVRLKAGDSFDPEGQPLRYEWLDSVDGMPSADLQPRTNPFATGDAEVGTGLYTIAVHEITLTVTAPDGRKSSSTLRVLVTGCEGCGG